jgi:membrane-associated protein
MDFLWHFIDIILHLNQYLSGFFDQYGLWIYPLLMLILFCETGLVVTPFLPGDSLLFAAGALFAQSNLSIHTLAVCLIIAVFLGDNTNYAIGRFIGKKIFEQKKIPIKKAYFDHAHAFYQRHGALTIILARFIPIVRTFVPNIAGISKMPYKRFIILSILAALIWILSLLYLSYFFGSLPFVQQHFSIIMLGIIVISVLPICVKYLHHFFKKRAKNHA